MSLLAILILLLVNIFNTISTNSPKVLLYQQFSQTTLGDQGHHKFPPKYKKPNQIASVCHSFSTIFSCT
jgi:hypothetical protein